MKKETAFKHIYLLYFTIPNRNAPLISSRTPVYHLGPIAGWHMKSVTMPRKNPGSRHIKMGRQLGMVTN